MLKVLLILGFPLLELYTLVLLGRVIPGIAVVGLVVLSFMAGSWLIRQQGRQAFFNVQQELGQGKVPQQVMLENLLVYAAGLLLIFPGILSDIMALFFIFPPTRQMLAALFVRKATGFAERGGFSNSNVFFYSSSSASSSRFQQYTVHTVQKDEGEVIDCVVDEEQLRNAPPVEGGNEPAGTVYDCTPTAGGSDAGKDNKDSETGKRSLE